MTGRTLLALILAWWSLLSCRPAPPPAAPHRPNVLLVSPDSLRVDRLALWSSDGVATPNIEALAARGTMLRNAWAVAPWTAPAMVSVFTGLYPPSHGVVYRDDTTAPAVPSLPKMLAQEGYELANFTFFSEISYFRNLGLPPRAPGLRHGRETAAFKAWLEQRDHARPFFAWIHLLEPHLPYGASGYQATAVQIPGSSGLERAQLQATVPVGTVGFEAGDRPKLRSLYDQDVARLDAAVGEILEGLSENGLESQTVVVLVADHGEELLDHGWVGHASTAVEAKLTPEILRIPMVLAGPGVAAGRVSDQLAQQVDVLPSLVELLGLARPAVSDGRPLPVTPGPEEPLSVLDRIRLRLATILGNGADQRRWAYFDSSPGGNLTPVERVGERLQGVTDGTCLLVSHRAPGAREGLSLLPVEPGRTGGCDQQQMDDLRLSLQRWREEQVEQRLAVLRLQPPQEAPAPDDVAGYAEAIAVSAPKHQEALRWEETSGQIDLRWDGQAPTYWIEYDIGSGVAQVSGSFLVEQSRLLFGPFPQGFWNDLAGYSPFRFRVLDPAGREMSAWVEFTVVAFAGGEG